jgi:hypothetical protein
MQASVSEPVLDPMSRKPELKQLPPRDHTMLPPDQFPDRLDCLTAHDR